MRAPTGVFDHLRDPVLYVIRNSLILHQTYLARKVCGLRLPLRLAKKQFFGDVDESSMNYHLAKVVTIGCVPLAGNEANPHGPIHPGPAVNVNRIATARQSSPLFIASFLSANHWKRPQHQTRAFDAAHATTAKPMETHRTR